MSTYLDTLRERGRTILAERLQQGFSKRQIARAGWFTTFTELETLLEASDDLISAGDIQAIAEALFVEPVWLLTGEASVLYSPCTFAALIEGHYGKAEPDAVDERFEPTWEMLKSAWIEQNHYTSFVEKNEYELGFDQFQARHERKSL